MMEENGVNKTDEIIAHKKWHAEFASYLTSMARMCDPEIIEIIIVWKNDVYDISKDYKAAVNAIICRCANEQTLNVECDSPMMIVKNIWRRME